MEELRQLPNDPAPKPGENPSANLSDADLMAQIQAEQKAIADKLNAPEPVAEPPKPIAPVVAEPTGQAAVAPVQQAQAVPVPAPVPNPPAPALTAQELMDKKGYTSVDQLAQSYANLEREFTRKRQEEARAMRQQPIAPQMPIAPVDGVNDPRQVVLDAINNDPLNAIGYIAEQRVQAKLAELEAQTREQKLHNTVTRLASDPVSQDFNSPAMQSEILKVFHGKPEWQGKVPEYLEDAYYIAKGRMSTTAQMNAFQAGKDNGAQVAAMKQQAVVEGAGRAPAPQKPSSPTTMPINDLRAAIEAEQYRIARGQ